jgi:hypothetical protein
MLTVACVLWQGFRTQYTPQHVERLMIQVRGRLPENSYRFVCLSNVDVGPVVERIPLEENWPGWWSKLELFRPGLFEDRVLYLDLDVVICDDLTPIVEFPAPFAAIQDYLKPQELNSSVMVFDPEAGRRAFDGDAVAKYAGDQEWITRAITTAGRFPKSWCPSYRLEVAKTGHPPGAKVVVFHGKPKPWDLG